MAEFRLSPKAQADLESIFDYTVKEWGQEQAFRYTDEIEAVCAALAEAPMQAQDCSYIRSGYRRRGVGRHMIYFTVASYGIAVARILHQRVDEAGRLNQVYFP